MRAQRPTNLISNILLSTICSTFLWASSTFAYNLEEYYPLAQGNAWTYWVTSDEGGSEKTVKVEGVERVKDADTVKVCHADDVYVCVASDMEGIKFHKDAGLDGYEIYTPPKLYFPVLRLGEAKQFLTTSTFYDITDTESGESSDVGEIILESMEEVKVPAGVFTNCLKYISTSEWKISDGSHGSESCSIWLAPGVGIVKKFCTISEYESEIDKEESIIEIQKLISAVIDGEKIGN